VQSQVKTEKVLTCDYFLSGTSMHPVPVGETDTCHSGPGPGFAGAHGQDAHATMKTTL